MSRTRLKAVAGVLLTACAMVGLAILAPERAPVGRVGVVQDESKGRTSPPVGKFIYVNIYTIDPDFDREGLVAFADANILPSLTRRIRGTGSAAILGNPTSALRIRLDADRMRAHGVSPDDIMMDLIPTRMLGPDEHRLSRPRVMWTQSPPDVFTYVGLNGTSKQVGTFILKASPEGEILRLSDVAEVEPRSFEVRPEIDGRPAAAIVLKPLPGRGGVDVEAIRRELEQARKDSFPPGMEFQVIPPDNPGTIDAVIQTSWDLPLEYTNAACRELEAIARGIDDVASAFSLVGYDIRVEGARPHAGTCLIHLKGRPDRKRSPRQVIQELEEKCRARNIDPDCFEPPA